MIEKWTDRNSLKHHEKAFIAGASYFVAKMFDMGVPL